MNKVNSRVIRIIVGGCLFAIALIVNFNNQTLEFGTYLVSYIIVGGYVVKKAAKNIIRGQVFDENFLMSIATIGAFFIGEYPEGVAVMLFYLVGETFQSYAVDKSRKSIASLMDIRPDYATILKNDELTRIDPYDVAIGDIIVIKPGEKIPLDGVVIEGYSTVDTSALTGESVPRDVATGQDVLSGCINISGVLTAKVTIEYGESTVSKILDLVENASSKKSKSEQFITKFAQYYTPIVVLIAVLLAFIPPLIIQDATFEVWIYRALAFLIVSCPCALVVSIPLSFFGGIGGASRNGILVKGSNYLEALALTEIIVFDKTGTLTKGVFNVQEIQSLSISKDELLKLTAYTESFSNHPISHSLIRAYGKEIDKQQISDVEEIPGKGIKAKVFGRGMAVGNFRLMEELSISYYKEILIGTVVHIAIDGEYAGFITISDEVKEDSYRAIKELKDINIKQTVMLTGDTKIVGEKVGSDLGIDKVYSELLPGDKVEKLEELFNQKSVRSKLAFVGDGINDAPVLARADIGIAMGGLGSDAAIEAADVVIMNDEPSKISTAIKISKKTLRIAHQNIFFSLTVKAIVLILSSFGLSTLWEAVIADVGVTMIAVLNSLRVLRARKY